ncbi:hypothetical protein APR09_000187 [Nocardia amikacinitolerans]|nr:hypothetical protein [Nocardia amikacinitolerans]
MTRASGGRCTPTAFSATRLTLDNYGHLFDDDLDGVTDRVGAGFRAAAAKCGQNVGKRPDLRVVGA